MPIVVVTGAPFSGKGQFVRDEIERREQDGELGLISIDYTALYSSVVPGEQSSFRDDAVVRNRRAAVGRVLVRGRCGASMLDRELCAAMFRPRIRRARSKLPTKRARRSLPSTRPLTR